MLIEIVLLVTIGYFALITVVVTYMVASAKCDDHKRRNEP
jgi:hypothetical protein